MHIQKPRKHPGNVRGTRVEVLGNALLTRSLNPLVEVWWRELRVPHATGPGAETRARGRRGAGAAPPFNINTKGGATFTGAAQALARILEGDPPGRKIRFFFHGRVQSPFRSAFEQYINMYIPMYEFEIFAQNFIEWVHRLVYFLFFLFDFFLYIIPD